MVQNDPPADQNFDIRTVKWYMGRGKIKPKEYQRYLEQLPDAREKAATMDTPQPSDLDTGAEGGE